VLAVLRKLFYATYLRRYMKLNPIPKEEISRWMLPVAAARLLEGGPGEQETLLRMVEERLQGPA
jgi:hypothetical protein